MVHGEDLVDLRDQIIRFVSRFDRDNSWPGSDPR